jgi:hypothetical protein
MKTIKNPNDIVDAFVADYFKLYGDDLLSVVMYGSAVTHEYRPGISDINMVIVLKDDSFPTIEKCMRTVKKWSNRRVSIPFFMTKDFITSALDSYPIEFLDMQTNYRILHGEDLFAHLDIKREHLRLQCERELRGIAIHLRKEFIGCGGNPARLRGLLSASTKKLLPLFKAIVALSNKAVPKLRGDVIMAVEDIYNLGASALSEVAHLSKQSKTKNEWTALFDGYAKIIDLIIVKIDKNE